MAINPGKFKSIVVLTGAGISAASGLRTYRGPGGLWNEGQTAKFSTAEGFAEDPEGAWQFWGGLRAVALAAEPNAAHLALAEFERRLTEKNSEAAVAAEKVNSGLTELTSLTGENGQQNRKFTIITQNIDNLHQRAGSRNVVELHGNGFRTRCSNRACPSALKPFSDLSSHSQGAPRCQCGSYQRPDIVLFNEELPAEAEWHAKRAMRDCDLFIAVGTSGTVFPAASFVDWAKYAGARTVLVNLEKMETPNRAFDQEILGPAEEILPALLGI